MKLLRSFLEAGGQESAMADAERFAWQLGQVSWAGYGWLARHASRVGNRSMLKGGAA